LTIIAKKYLIF